MVRLVLLLLSLALPAWAQPHGDRRVPLLAMAEVDLARYAGRWFGIARMPNWFERGCAGVTADYALLPDGRLEVINTCRDAATGRVRSVSGAARVVGPGQLAVRFSSVPFVTGDYVILHVSPRYDLAVVGEPRRRYAWVLARQPRLGPDQWETAREVLRRNGYRPEALEIVAQP
jgi:apolipoprotein D and lipocalin family protein